MKNNLTLKRQDVIFLKPCIILLGLFLSSCLLPDAVRLRDTEEWPRYRVNLEYDYGDTVIFNSEIVSKPHEDAPVSLEYYCALGNIYCPRVKDTVYLSPDNIYNAFRIYSNEKRGMTVEYLDGTKITRNYFMKLMLYTDSRYLKDSFIIGWLSSEGLFKYNDVYKNLPFIGGYNYQDDILVLLESEGIAINYTGRRGTHYNWKKIDNLQYSFLHSSNDSLAFSFTFQGSCLDEDCLPDSVRFTVKGQVDMYERYFQANDYALGPYPPYSEILQ